MDKKQQKQFLKALETMVEEKGIDKELVIEAISQAFQSAYSNKLSNELLIDPRAVKNRKITKKVSDEEGNVKSVKLADAIIKCDINLKNGSIDTYRLYNVLNEDDITDDFIEISVDDERCQKLGLKVGDTYREDLDFNDFSKGDVDRFITAYKQKISRYEKESLLQEFEGKIGQLVNGVVEKADQRSVICTIGRLSVTLFKKDLIGNESFKSGDSIKVYLKGINKDENKDGNRIQCSRSCPEFLEKLFVNEIHEIYTGVVKIKGVARNAGNRSKVAVYSEDPNVDASGSCIGANGSRIQTIVSQLGNDKNNKEKIDIVLYNRNLGLYLKECLKPGILVGIKFDETNGGTSAIAVCQNQTSSAAIGLRGINVILARQLTGLKEIKVIDEDEAKANNIDYKLMVQYEVEAREEERELYHEKVLKENNIVEEKVVETKPVEEAKVVETVVKEEPKVEEVKTEEVKIEEPKKVKKVDVIPTEISEVNTTTTLDLLEASLEKEKQENKAKAVKANTKKKKKEDDKVEIKKVEPQERMAIYTEQEEQEFLDQEDVEFDDFDEEDYDELIDDYMDYGDDN